MCLRNLLTEQNFNANPDVLSVTTPDSNDTITLRDDGTRVSERFTACEGDLPSSLYDCIGEKSDHSISDFLSRYVIIQQGTWSSTSVRGDVLSNLVFPKNLFNTGQYMVVQNINKIDGFTGFKAKVRVRIEVNSQPFQAGALMLHYVPYSEYMNSHTQWYATSSKADPVAASGCPHVIMNLANTTSMEFVTPYVSPYLYFNLATGQGSFGNVVISVLSGLSSQSSTTAHYTIWAKFEDVELRYPTDAPLTSNYAQIGNEVAKMESRKSISSTVGSLGNAIADTLPWVGLGWLSSPARMISDAGESVLKMLGFSKPSVEAPVTRVKNSPAQYFMNCDGADTSHKLSVSAANALITPSGWAGTDSDEMRLDYIASRPCYATSFNWVSTDTADKSLFLLPVSPMYTMTPSEASPNAYARTLSMPLCAKVASFFSLWRGTMVYRIQVIKTQFHSGRLRISYRPYIYDDNNKISDMPAYAYTEEIDLSTGTDFTFEVPFVSTRPWMQTYYDIKTSVASGDARNVATGCVQISVINPLVSPVNVSSTVEVLVYASMKHAQFASPIRPPIVPCNIPDVAQIGKARLIKTEESSAIQNTPSDLPLLPYSTCVGEVITSFRQLLKRASYVGRVEITKASATTETPGSTGSGFVIFPWAPVSPQRGDFVATLAGKMIPQYSNSYIWYNNNNSQEPDLYSNLYSMFSFFRGSVRYKLVLARQGPNFNYNYPVKIFINVLAAPMPETWSPSMGVNTSVSVNLGTGPLQVLADDPKITSENLKTNFAYTPGFTEYSIAVYPSLEGVIEFEVPFQSSGHMCPTNYGINDATSARSIFFPIPTVTVVGTEVANGNSLTGCKFDVYRSVGDDFSFGGLLGAPQQAIWYAAKDPK